LALWADFPLLSRDLERWGWSDGEDDEDDEEEEELLDEEEELGDLRLLFLSVFCLLTPSFLGGGVRPRLLSTLSLKALSPEGSTMSLQPFTFFPSISLTASFASM
jgi:hypothetical protein